MVQHSKALCVKTVLLLSLLLLMAAPVVAFGEEPAFCFELTIDGGVEKQVNTGDTITVALHLRRTDNNDSFTMYAMQDEILYDPAFFRVVAEDTLTQSGVCTADVAAADGRRAFYFSFVSFNGGEMWSGDTLVGVFSLRVTGETGAATLENSRYLVSDSAGSETYTATAQDVTVVVTNQCTVNFDTNGGSAVSSRTVSRGQRLTCPEAPTRDGFRLTGWYRDAALTRPWNFETDTVEANTTLYAGWEAIETPATLPAWWLMLTATLAVVIVTALVWRRTRRARFPRGE